MTDTFASLGAIGMIIGFVGLIMLGFFALIMPVSVYNAQKWAKKCYLELEKINKRAGK